MPNPKCCQALPWSDRSHTSLELSRWLCSWASGWRAGCVRGTPLALGSVLSIIAFDGPNSNRSKRSFPQMPANHPLFKGLALHLPFLRWSFLWRKTITNRVVLFKAASSGSIHVGTGRETWIPFPSQQLQGRSQRQHCCLTWAPRVETESEARFFQD